MKQINVGDLTIKYNSEDLIKKLDKYQWEEPWGNCYCDESWMADTKEEFEEYKEAFKQELLKLDETLPKLIKDNVKLTKAGLPHKGRRHLLIESGIITSYSDEHGSHAYDAVCLYPNFKEDRVAYIDLDTFSFQSSF